MSNPPWNEETRVDYIIDKARLNLNEFEDRMSTLINWHYANPDIRDHIDWLRDALAETNQSFQERKKK